MADAEFDTALGEAARLLGHSNLPVIAGDFDAAATAAAVFRLARRLGGAVDHVAAEASLREQAVLADVGLMLVSPGEARQRADVFLLVGDGPLDAWPELPRFLFGEGPTPFSDPTPQRRIVALCSRESGPWHAGNEVAWRKSEPEDIPLLLGAMRARVAGQPIAPTVDKAEIDFLVDLLKSARFGVALSSAGELDVLALEMLTGLIKDLNAETRWSGLSVVPEPNAVAASMAAGWLTGLPLRTGFGRSFPEHDPWRFDLRRLVEAGEADAVVWITISDEPLPAWLRDVAAVVLSSQAVSMPAGNAIAVPIRLAAPEHEGIVFDRRTGTLTRQAATAQSRLPSAAEALDRIAARLP